MKKASVILSIILLCSVLCVPFSAFANSAQREFEGVSSTGVIVKDENCPVIVTKENLVFDITTFPSAFDDVLNGYDAKVSAEYTFYNPADYDVNMQLVFPFGKLPSYAYDAGDYSDASKYSAYVNNQAVTTTLRATYSNDGQFSVDADLPKISDTRAPWTAFADDTPVYKYTIGITYVGKPDNADRVYARFTKDSQALFLGSVDRYNVEELSSRQYALSLYGGSATVYSVGEQLSSDFFAATYFAEEFVRTHNIFASSNYRTETTQIDGSVNFVEEQLTVEDLIFKYYSDELGVTRNDYYNAVTCMLNAQTFKGGVAWIYCFNVSDMLLLWYQYDVSVPAKQSVVNKVVAPLYPTINDYYTPSKYYYEYYLSPATCWASFADLDITVNTNAFMSEYTLSAFEKTEYGYHAHYDQLPQSELQFALCDSENPEQDKGALGIILTVFLVIVLIILGLILLAVIVGIVCAIVIPIVLTRKKQDNASNLKEPSQIPTERKEDSFKERQDSDSDDKQ